MARFACSMLLSNQAERLTQCPESGHPRARDDTLMVLLAPGRRRDGRANLDDHHDRWMILMIQGKGDAMNLAKAVAACIMVATITMAQESNIRVRSIRVLATDPEAIATFYEKAFGMSETRRPVQTATFKEIVINSGSTADKARMATTTAIVIATRPKDALAGAMASLILEVPDLDKAIASVKANGGTLMRPPNKSAEGLNYAFAKDPDGNQIELLMATK